MVKEVASIMKDRVSSLPFLDVIAGVAQPVIDVKFRNGDNMKIEKKMPVSYDLVGGKSAILGMERQLVPDQSKKSILYFEDFGTTQDTGARASALTMSYISTIRLVCWINKTKMVQYKYREITAQCIAQINRALITGTSINSDGITRLMISLNRIPIQNADIFSRYNYDEAELQYLRPPFEYFAIDYTCKYRVKESCLPYINFEA